MLKQIIVLSKSRQSIHRRTEFLLACILHPEVRDTRRLHMDLCTRDGGVPEDNYQTILSEECECLVRPVTLLK